MYIFDMKFLDEGKRLWNPKILDDIFKVLKEFKQSGDPGSSERSLDNLIFELSNARNTFVKNMQDLNIIMKCRVKGDNDSHFGGDECSVFMKETIRSIDKYLRVSEYSIPLIEGSVADAVSKVKQRARLDEQYAKKFEKETKQNYITYGKDNTLNIFRESGYMV